MSNLFEQAKEKMSDAVDATKDAAANLHEKIVGEKSTEEKAAENVKEKVDKAADMAKDAHEKMSEKTEEVKDCGRNYMDRAGVIRDA
ncbi:hypothetical protein L596_019564 [Steinernema carpocapsae]|uniref:Uncharacterized protein n=1 Tax=Steinernema carpocapsae TaxID=34508 RepID=A0A4U5MRQ3_STECR|nr:hypothetical protein L596_019564 [Steinernema carpocapsae]